MSLGQNVWVGPSLELNGARLEVKAPPVRPSICVSPHLEHKLGGRGGGGRVEEFSHERSTLGMAAGGYALIRSGFDLLVIDIRG